MLDLVYAVNYVFSPASLIVIHMSSYNIPLVADIHFAPTVALRVAECFDKIRVNPGNFGVHLSLHSLVLVYFLFLHAPL